ncbi:TIGR04168 family protein [Geitlerinema splendidum]|nr:TIGR04168 family protein [Geitlerinema splendidum]
MSKKAIAIAVVGDIHDRWDATDGEILKALGIDLVLFVGDFGNESIPVVSAIADLKLPKAAITGNHDCWYTASPWGQRQCPYDRNLEDRVQQQLDLLGETHVGYHKLDFPEFNLTVVGSRPFSWGGPDWKNAAFYRDRFGVEDFQQSTERIVAAVKQAKYDTVLFLGHCGPTGLGDKAEDPCGKDWNPLGGDFGDPDFAEAIAQTRRLGKTIPLVAFGHMHHHLRHTQTQLRKSLAVSPEGTVYLNAARVPRIVTTQSQEQRNFSLVTLEKGQVTQASLIWANLNGEIVSQENLYQLSPQVVQPA